MEIDYSFVLVTLNSALVLFIIQKLFSVAEDLKELKERFINIESIINNDRERKKKRNRNK